MALSIVFFLVYVAIVVAIGTFSSRKETEDDFMIAERKVRGLQMIATMTAGMFDGAILAIYIAYVYLYGLSAIWFFVGLGLGFLVLRSYGPAIKKRADQFGAYSMSEYFGEVLGKRNGLMFSVILVVQFFGYMIINLILSGKVLSAIFPIRYGTAVLIGGLIILSYLFLAGFKAVVRTDFFQLGIMIVMSVTVGVFLFGRTPVNSQDFDIFKMGAGNIFAFLVLAGASIVVAPDLWQRIFAAHDDKNVKRGLGYASFLPLILAIIVTVLGIATKNFFPDIKPEDALVAGFSRLLPVGVKEFGMVLLYAVSLSSTDTVTFVVSSIFTRDLQKYSRQYSEESMKKLTRFFMVLFVGFAIVVGIFYQNILQVAFSFGSLNLALVPVVIGSLYWKLSETAVFWTLIVSVVAVLAMFVAGVLNPQTAVVSLPVALVALIVFHIPSFWRHRRQRQTVA